jgi:hypothetical protein
MRRVFALIPCISSCHRLTSARVNHLKNAPQKVQLAAPLLCALGDTSFQQHFCRCISPLLHATLCCHSGDPCCARYMRVCADDVRLHSLTSCISWSIHTCPQVMRRCRTPFNNTAAHLRSDVPLCSLLCCCTLLLLLPIAARCLSAVAQ